MLALGRWMGALDGRVSVFDRGVVAQVNGYIHLDMAAAATTL